MHLTSESLLSFFLGPPRIRAVHPTVSCHLQLDGPVSTCWMRGRLSRVYRETSLLKSFVQTVTGLVQIWSSSHTVTTWWLKVEVTLVTLEPKELGFKSPHVQFLVNLNNSSSFCDSELLMVRSAALNLLHYFHFTLRRLKLGPQISPCFGLYRSAFISSSPERWSSCTVWSVRRQHGTAPDHGCFTLLAGSRSQLSGVDFKEQTAEGNPAVCKCILMRCCLCICMQSLTDCTVYWPCKCQQENTDTLCLSGEMMVWRVCQHHGDAERPVWLPEPLYVDPQLANSFSWAHEHQKQGGATPGPKYFCYLMTKQLLETLRGTSAERWSPIQSSL